MGSGMKEDKHINRHLYRQIKNTQIKLFQNRVLRWYKQNQRDLPWRKTRDPYNIFLSEVMLQQTQVERVIPYYNKFLKALPNFSALAKANNKTLLRLWSGLGYNSRVLRLKQCAQQILKKYNSQLPNQKTDLQKLPGIGPYTASVILAFAYNKETPVIDTNIRRILIHEFQLSKQISDTKMEEIATILIPKGKSCIWHNALMDYGALELTARKTKITSKSTQSNFKFSERRIRGRIIAELLGGSKDIANIAKKYPHNNFNKIITKLAKEKMIIMKGKKIRIR